jgi:hypothetical protein
MPRITDYRLPITDCRRGPRSSSLRVADCSIHFSDRPLGRTFVSFVPRHARISAFHCLPCYQVIGPRAGCRCRTQQLTRLVQVTDISDVMPQPELGSADGRRRDCRWDVYSNPARTRRNVVLSTSGAEEVGFEPTVTLRPQRFSRPSDSSTLALLQVHFVTRRPSCSHSCSGSEVAGYRDTGRQSTGTIRDLRPGSREVSLAEHSQPWI